MDDGRLLTLGALDAGYETQCDGYVVEFDRMNATTGDLLRPNKVTDTEYGTPRNYLDDGELIPDFVFNKILEGEGVEQFALGDNPRNHDRVTSLDSIVELVGVTASQSKKMY